MSTPYIGFGNDTLAGLARAKKGDVISCPRCAGKHLLEAGKDEDGNEVDLLLFYTCDGKPYLGAVGGRLTAGRKPDVSGSV